MEWHSACCTHHRSVNSQGSRILYRGLPTNLPWLLPQERDYLYSPGELTNLATDQEVRHYICLLRLFAYTNILKTRVQGKSSLFLYWSDMPKCESSMENCFPTDGCVINHSWMGTDCSKWTSPNWTHFKTSLDQRVGCDSWHCFQDTCLKFISLKSYMLPHKPSQNSSQNFKYSCTLFLQIPYSALIRTRKGEEKEIY